MCGIVAYISRNDTKNTRNVLVKGIKSLEYRGYDSAGVAMLSVKGKINYSRSLGEVANLKERLSKNEDGGYVLGIAHTRWATHGRPSIKNAHPHKAGNIYLVHNGIIENYRELKEELVKQNCKFNSDTDSEVLAHMISVECKKGKDLHKATRDALSRVRGAYAVVAFSSKESDVLVAARSGSPLIIGVGDREHIIASDSAAIIPYTKRVVYLDDGEVAEVSADGYRVTNIKDKKKHKKERTIDWDENEARLQGYPHFMLKEIFEQPMCVAEAMRGRANARTGKVKLGGLEGMAKELNAIKRIIIISCGTSYHAGLVGKYLFEEFANIPTEVEVASEFRYRNSPITKGTAVLAISQSGETADTIAALKHSKKEGALALGIVNAVGSTISRETDAGVYNHAGPEVAVASTKAFVSQITILILLTVFLGMERGMKNKTAKKLLSELYKIPKRMEEFLHDNKELLKKIGKRYAKFEKMMYLGRKYQYPIALEGALKIKEIAYICAEGYPAGEMKHGPIALIDKDVPSIVFAPNDSVYEKVLGTIEEIKARGGKILAIVTKDSKEAIKLSNDSIIVPKTCEPLMPLLTVLPAQLLAYYSALARGNNVDRPRNLAKSVTVE